MGSAKDRLQALNNGLETAGLLAARGRPNNSISIAAGSTALYIDPDKTMKYGTGVSISAAPARSGTLADVRRIDTNAGNKIIVSAIPE